jgi:hypothetical protein
MLGVRGVREVAKGVPGWPCISVWCICLLHVPCAAWLHAAVTAVLVASPAVRVRNPRVACWKFLRLCVFHVRMTLICGALMDALDMRVKVPVAAAALAG